MFYTVYRITNLVNGKIYVGVHKTNNLDDGYMGSGRNIKRAISKHGEENFRKDYLAVFDNPDDMYQMESTIVNSEFVNSPNVYNIKEGGCGGFDHLNTTSGIDTRRDSINRWLAAGSSQVNKKFYEDIEYRENHLAHLERIRPKALAAILALGGSFKGKSHTDDTKQKMSLRKQGMYDGNKNPQYGKIWIYSLTEKKSMRIPKNEFALWVDKGWLKGRKIKF